MPDPNILSFDDLLRAARRQSEPQRLLFVFAGAELPDGSTDAQRARFAAGEGGALVPLMCVDKAPEELTTFAALAEESRTAGPAWSIVFVAAIAGNGGRAVTPPDADAALQRMVAAIQAGAHQPFLPFDPTGRPVSFE